MIYGKNTDTRYEQSLTVVHGARVLRAIEVMVFTRIIPHLYGFHSDCCYDEIIKGVKQTFNEASVKYHIVRIALYNTWCRSVIYFKAF